MEQLQRATFIIGNKEYAASKIPPFEGNSILLKLKNIVLPVLGSLTVQGGNLLDMDLKDAFSVLSEKLDDKAIAEIVMPMFKLAQVASVTDNMKIDSPQAINKVFEIDTLGDFYELVFEVMRYNFQAFFVSAMSRFGAKRGTPEATALTGQESGSSTQS